jgi:Fur family peroxide stress response transcriptional regulator
MKVDETEVSRRMELYEAALRSAGVKRTHQRLEIFREVAASLDHPSAEAVFQAVRVRLPTVSLDTVYRTLRLLGELGVLGTLGPRRESQRFDANLAPHHHFVCQRCGLARDFTSGSLDHLDLPDSLAALGTVLGTQVEVRGVCHACNRAGPREG